MLRLSPDKDDCFFLMTAGAAAYREFDSNDDSTLDEPAPAPSRKRKRGPGGIAYLRKKPKAEPKAE